MDLTTIWEGDRAKTDSKEVLTDKSVRIVDIEGLNEFKPKCLVRILFLKNVFRRWNQLKTEIILSLNGKPSLFIFFHTFAFRLSRVPTKKCICTQVHGGCPIIILNNKQKVERTQKMCVLYIPSRPELYVNTYYYFNRMPGRVDYQVAPFNNCYHRDTTSLINDMILKLNANRRRNVCLIILGKFDCLYNELIYFATCLKNSDKTREIPVIGGTMTELMFCDAVTCRSKVYGIILAIHGFYMKAWTLSLDASCDTEEKIRMKFVEFKGRVKLKTYSFGYMFYCRDLNQSLVNSEMIIFKETFPNVDLFTIHGASGYAGDDLNDIFPFNYKSSYQQYSSMSAHIMVITYH